MLSTVFIIRNKKSLHYSLRRPSRSDFVQLRFSYTHPHSFQTPVGLYHRELVVSPYVAFVYWLYHLFGQNILQLYAPHLECYNFQGSFAHHISVLWLCSYHHNETHQELLWMSILHDGKTHSLKAKRALSFLFGYLIDSH